MSKIYQSDVIAVIENALELKLGSLGDATRFEDIESWDSLGRLSVLVALDTLFDGKIANISEMAEAKSIPEIINILKVHSLL